MTMLIECKLWYIASLLIPQVLGKLVIFPYAHLFAFF